MLRGSSFCQASLTDYYRGLYLIENGLPPRDASDKAIYFPIRRFKDSALSLPDGFSIISKLVSIGHLLVIEDVDCNPAQLHTHLKYHGLNQLAVSDATDRQRMRSSRLLCVCDKFEQSHLPGKRIW